MKKRLLAVLMLVVLMALAGCGDGGGHHAPQLFLRQILSDEAVDADVMRDSATGALTVTQVTRDRVPSVFAGVDPLDLNEFRAFLDFPLGSVPVNGIIQSATLDIVVDSIQPSNATIPLRIELVSFQPPVFANDFDRALLPPIASTEIIPPITAADVGHHVTVDVTGLMVKAQFLGLDNFQVRLFNPSAPTPGLVEIDDTGSQTAPLLTVVFF
jgi:hypothetical protein